MTRISVLNGDGGSRITGNPINGYRSSGSSRIQASPNIQGAGDYDSDIFDPAGEYTPEQIRVLFDQAVAIGDPDATLQGWKDWKKKFKARREEKKAARSLKKSGKKADRARRKEARTRRIESGETFFNQIGGAARDWGRAQAAASELGEQYADMGIDVPVEDLITQARDFVVEAGAEAGSGAISDWFKKNWIPVTAVTAVGVTGIALAIRAGNKNKKKK